MWVKCDCRKCQRPIEFEALHAGSTIDCPHCGQPTVLIVPPRPNLPPLFQLPSVFGVRMCHQVEEYLLLLQDKCLVRDPLPTELLRDVGQFEQGEWPRLEDFVAYLRKHWPQALRSKSYAAKKRAEARMLREILREGEPVPALPVPDLPPRAKAEDDASVRQKQFLRSLGVKDDALLDSLGRNQAHFLIDWAVDYRLEH